MASTTSVRRFGQAINDAHHKAMELDESVFVFGLGADGPTGVFGTTSGLKERFGSRRVFDTPVSEQALTMMAAGAANAGLRPVLVHQRMDFMMYTMDQWANWISLWRFKSAGRSGMPLTVRAIVGKGWGQGPQHGKSPHAMFAHMPGIQVVMPSSAADAKGLLLASIFSDAPTLFIEGRSLYAMEEPVPDDAYFIRIGKAFVRRPGNDLTIVSFGSSVPAALQAAVTLEGRGVSVEVIDLRSIAPLDTETIHLSLAKTGRLAVVEPGWRHFGVAAEVIASAAEASVLRKPPVRVTWPHSHLPTSAPLEESYYPSPDDIVKACAALV